MKRIEILNVSIDNLTKAELLERLKKEGGTVVTPNVDHLMLLQKDPDFFKAYQSSDYRVCDSKIIFYASKFLGNPIREKISGSDLFPAFYEDNRDNEDVKIFLLGAAPGVAKKAQEKINHKVGREIVIDSSSPSYGFEKSEEECEKIVERINKSGATVLAIGLGAPKQEKWIWKYRDKLKKIKIVLEIGATIDFEAGNKPRSPKWMSELGVEWLYRLLQEPKRLWKRYLIEDMPFFWLVMKQKLKLYKAPAWSNIEPEKVEKREPMVIKRSLGQV
jgi:N-acetylglucosaminyldiphosphoundecaprenol N-acetyl-beta-D-mannosaminyltransferase